MAEAHRLMQKMIQGRDRELEIKDREIALLNKELKIWKDENVLLQRQITTMEELKNERVNVKQEKNETIEETPNVIKNMKEEIQRLKEEKTDIEKTHNNIVEDMKNEIKKLKEEGTNIEKRHNTVAEDLKKEIMRLMEEKEITEQTNTINIQKMNYEITEMTKEKLTIQETHNDMVQILRNELSELKSKVNPEEEINRTESTGVIQNYQDRQNGVESDETISQSTSDEENIDESKKEQNRPTETIHTGMINSATYRRKKCFRCGSQDHLIRSCKSAYTTEVKYHQDRPCEICKKQGHRKEDGWFKDQKDGQKRCFRCGSVQHLVKECTEPRKTFSPVMANKDIVAEHKTMPRIEKYEQQRSVNGKDTEIMRVLNKLLQEFQRCRMSFKGKTFWRGG